MKRLVAVQVSILLLALAPGLFAQLEPIPEELGATGLALQLRKLDRGAIFMETTAHPDDEDNALLVMLARGRGLRTVLLTVTRGDGGQNEIGPELFEAIGILRTEELMAMHRVDGAEQFFTRAYEFGYSFSVEETLEKWGKEEILGDIVHIIRQVRPDVVASLFPAGEGGGQHHQTSAILTHEAFEAAADPNRFPEQIAAGLRPWQPLKLYSRVGIGASSRTPDDEAKEKRVELDTGRYDPVLGRTYYQMGLTARSNHRCQGMAQLRALPGPHDSIWRLEKSVIDVEGDESDLFDGIDTGLARWKLFARGETVDTTFLSQGLDRLQAEVDAANTAFDSRAPWKTLPPLRAGLKELRALRRAVAQSGLSEGAQFELEHRLAPKEEDFEKAIALAHGIGFDTIADRGEVTPGSKLEVELQLANPSPEPVSIASLDIEAPPSWPVTAIDPSARDERTRGGRARGPRRTSGPPLMAVASTRGHAIADNHVVKVAFEVEVAEDAPYARPYWKRNEAIDRFDLSEPDFFGLPAKPSVLTSRVRLRSGDVEFTIEKPVQHRYEGAWVGTEKQKEVSVLPLLSLNLTPEVVVFPTGAEDKTRPVSVNVVYKGSEPVEASLQLEAPAGWQVEPAEASLKLERENQAATVRFEVTPPAEVATGTYRIRALGRVGGKEFREGFQTIDYHHIHTRYLFHPAEAKVEALDLQVAAVKVGYVMGVGDEIPTAIRQLGAELVFLEREDLAEGDLSQYDVIMTGIRAYLNRDDLRAYNDRLLDYVHEGGTLLVQYNKFEFNDAQWGPYPKKVSNNRVTVEEAPIQILAAEHPVFNHPNKITENDWKGWVQERGLYFLDEEGDPRYRELLASEDPWDYNAGTKKGMLVEAEYGKGRWMYIGLGFWRQLPAGVPDAYKVFANLLSLPKAVPESEE